jgi:tetratricopeptide (TPR) repeat protein
MIASEKDLPREIRGLAWPWWLSLLPLVLLVFPARQVMTDLRVQGLLREATQANQTLEFDQALQLVRQAALLSPEDPEVQLQLASTARALWNFRETVPLQREADQAYAEAARLSPHAALPWYEHARMYSLKGQDVRALKFLDGALSRDPNNAGYWLERARLLERTGQIVPARQAYQTCLSRDEVPECRAALKRLGAV